MSHYAAAPLLQGALAAGLLLLILVQAGRSRAVGRWFALFLLGQMLWGLAVFGLRASGDLDWALRWERLTPAAVSLTVSSFYCFSVTMVRAPLARWVAVMAAVHLVASVGSSLTPYLVAGVEVASYGNTAVWGRALIPWTAPVYLMMGLSLAALYRGFRSSESYTERNRLLLLLIAASVSVAGSALDVAPVLGLDVPPATAWTNSLFFILAGVAILRYHLLDIQVAFQHRFSYLLRSSLHLGVIGTVVVVFWRLGLPPWGMAILALGLLLAAEPGWRRLDTFIRTRFERDLAGELQALFALGTGQTGVTRQQVSNTLLNLIRQVVRPVRCAVLSYEDGYARPLVSYGYPVSVETSLQTAHPLLLHLQSHREPALHDDLVVEPEFQSMGEKSAEALSALDANVYVPLGGRASLEGVLVIGPKPRRAVYTWQEMKFLSMLGQQGGLLLESIRLYRADQVQRERIVHIREVQKQLVAAREEERRSLAAEIHDEPIQMLVGSLVRLNLIRDSLVTRPQLSQQQIDHAITNLTLAEKSMRRIMTGVFPALLQDLGLTAALESLCEDFHRNGLATAPLHISIKVSGIPRGWKLPMGIGLAIYRFVQEGLNNVVGHAGATQAEVTIEYGVELVTLQVVDNGRGVDTQRLLSRRREGHVGLLGLEERLGALGGSITLDSLPAGGGRLRGQFYHECPSPDVGAHWTFEYELTPVSLIKESAKGPAVEPVQTHG